MAEAGSGVLPREDKATAMRVLSLSGKPSASRSGRAVSTLIRKVPGLRRHLPGGFVREAAMANAGPLVETRRCISPHVFAAVMAHSRELLSAVRPWRYRWRPTRIARNTLEPIPTRGHRSRRRLATGACSSAAAPRGGVRKTSAPTPNVARALNPASARHDPAWPCAARFVRASCSAARLSSSRS
jgi:hypothetical protein